VIFRFIAAKKAEHAIKTMCRVLGVSHSGLHAWANRPPSARRVEDDRLVARIHEVHAANRGVYGFPRIHAELRARRRRPDRSQALERLMWRAGMTGLRPKKCGRTTIRVPGVRVCDDLVDRAFLAAAPNRLWVADITYLRTNNRLTRSSQRRRSPLRTPCPPNRGKSTPRPRGVWFARAHALCAQPRNRPRRGQRRAPGDARLTQPVESAPHTSRWGQSRTVGQELIICANTSLEAIAVAPSLGRC
jgi:helix-turn-helix protein